jgi:hypothetical protein
LVNHSSDNSAAALLLSFDTRTSLIGIALMLRTRSVLPRLLLHATSADRLLLHATTGRLLPMLLLLLQAAARLAGRGPAAAGRISMRAIMLPYMSGGVSGCLHAQSTKVLQVNSQQQFVPVPEWNAATPGVTRSL